MIRKFSKFSFLILLAGILLVGLKQPVSGQDPQPTPSDNEVNRVAKEMYCPVCENTPLDVCPTQACSEWRELIRLKLSEGWSDEQIKQYFAMQYGDRVLNEPPRSGLNWLIYVLPGLFFVGGAIILRRALRGARNMPSLPIETPIPDDDPYVKKLEDELKSQE